MMCGRKAEVVAAEFPATFADGKRKSSREELHERVRTKNGE